MESNKKNNGGDEHEQPPRTAQKRTFNELTKDEDKPAEAAGQEDQNSTNSKKNREEGNDMDLELESFSREELIKLVRKQMTTTMEAQKQLETAKNEAEEFSQRIVNLEQEKAEIREDLHQKMAEIVEMHKEVEKKSEELAKKAKQIDALLLQLEKTTSRQHQGLPTEQQMKIQLSLETWFDMLAFVPRRRLGKIVPKIGDRRFASIVQKFLHEYREIMIGHIQIVAPDEEDPSGLPRVRVWGKVTRRDLSFKMAEAQMPANIKNFDYIELSYLDQSVLNFMQKFQQNGLLDNVHICIWTLPKDIVQSVLCHLLPLINGINSINLEEIAQLVAIYDAGNSKEIYELNMKMMEKTRVLCVRHIIDYTENLDANKIDLYCRWLYQIERADGKPRVLQFGRTNTDYSPIYLFIDRIKQDFLLATNPATIFIRIRLSNSFQLQEAICLDNDKTKERFVTKMEETGPKMEKWGEVFLLISRYPLASTKKWIEENEKEVLAWEVSEVDDRKISLTDELQIVAT